MEKLEMDSKQVFDFVGYQFDMKDGKVRPTLERWQTLATKIREFSIGLYMLFFFVFFVDQKLAGCQTQDLILDQLYCIFVSRYNASNR